MFLHQSAGSSQIDIKLEILITTEDHKGEVVKTQMEHPQNYHRTVVSLFLNVVMSLIIDEF